MHKKTATALCMTHIFGNDSEDGGSCRHSRRPVSLDQAAGWNQQRHDKATMELGLPGIFWIIPTKGNNLTMLCEMLFHSCCSCRVSLCVNAEAGSDSSTRTWLFRCKDVKITSSLTKSLNIFLFPAAIVTCANVTNHCKAKQSPCQDHYWEKKKKIPIEVVFSMHFFLLPAVRTPCWFFVIIPTSEKVKH